MAGLVEQLLELDPGSVDRSVPLLDLGADSLVLVELSREVKSRFGVDISVQQLLEDVVTVRAVGRWVSEAVVRGGGAVVAPEPVVVGGGSSATPVSGGGDVEGAVAGLVEQLLELDPGSVDRSVPLLDLGADSLVLVELSREVKSRFGVDISVQQLLEDVVTVRAVGRWVSEAVVRGGGAVVAPEPVVVGGGSSATPAAEGGIGEIQEVVATPAVEQPGHQRDRGVTYAAATVASRELSRRSQGHLCNNRKIAQREHEERAASYPIWIDRSSGAHVWDADGRELIDLTMGYGAHLFGHNPDFVREAVERQIERGFHIGAEIAQTAEVAELLCELTRMDRVNFCVTGTEAVFTAIRLARAYTGRTLVVLLQGAYHGHSDSTLFSPRPGKRREHLATPSFPGVSPSAAEDVRVLPVSEQHLADFMAAHGEEVAAVVMEPRLNQSPDIDLASLARTARSLTEKAGALLVFDEVLTGFRFHVQGFQGIYGVRADLATYGKTLAAGLPMAAVAGRADIMDLIDGGPWTDEVRADPDRVSFTGGTYAKHPLSVAAAGAVLRQLAREGDGVLAELNAAGDDLRAAIVRVLEDSGVGVRVLGTGSFFRFVPAASTSFAYGGKAFHEFRRMMIAEGVLVPETGNCFLSPAHTAEVRSAVLDAVAGATQRLARGGDAEVTPDSGRSPSVSLALFGFAANGENDIYSRLLDLVEVAEAEGLANVWLPERHFDDFAGFSPNPAVLGAMVAMRTSRIGIRAGSSVLPLHSAISVAEDWAMVDVASGGRVGLGVASGWMKRDFVLSEGTHAERRELFRTRVAQLERLWRGEALTIDGKSGERTEVRLHPRPLSDLRLWQACVGSPDSFYEAGRAGRGVLTNLIQQDLAQLTGNLERYRQGRRDGGLPPDGGDVTVLLHAAVSTDEAAEQRNVEALERYMFATFRSTHDNPELVSEDTWAPRMKAAANRLRDGLSLVGPEAEWAKLTTELARLGVTDIACLVDFLPPGQAWNDTMRALGRLSERLASTPAEAASSADRPAEPAERIDAMSGEPGGDRFPVSISRATREIWAACQISVETREAYVIDRTFLISPAVDLGRLQCAYLDTIAAQPAYRLRINTDGVDGWVEPFGEEHRQSWQLIDGIAESVEDFAAAVRARSYAEPLDPVARCGVRLTCQRSTTGVFLNLRASHVVLDGMRFAELLDSVAARYQGRPVQELAIPAVAQFDRESGERDRAHWNRWVDTLPDEAFEAGFDARTLDRRGYRLSGRLASDLRAGLASYARSERSTSFVEALRAAAEIIDETLGGHQLYAFPAKPSVVEYGSCAVLAPFWLGPVAGDDPRPSAKGAVMSGVEHGSLTFRQVFNDVTRRVQTPTVTVSWDNLEAFALDGHQVDEVSMPTDVVRFPLAVTFTQRPGGDVELSIDAAQAFLPKDRGELLLVRLIRGLGERFVPTAEPEAATASDERDREDGGVDRAERVSAEGLARLVRGLAEPLGDPGAAESRLDGRVRPLDLVVTKARASARVLAEEEPGSLDAEAVVIDIATAFDATVALLVTGMVGIAGRVREAGASGRLVIVGTDRSDGGSAGDGTVFALSRWAMVGAEETLALSPSSAEDLDAALSHVLRSVGADQGAEVMAALRALVDEYVGDVDPDHDGDGRRPAGAEVHGYVPELVRGIWKRVLDGSVEFGDEDDFFDLGGDSVDAIRIMAILNQELRTELDVALIFDNPTVSSLSRAVTARI
ncbi:aminotransferase class III-fold pyridoxal phosphate-dependent enzyme [Micromonospora sp. WMMD1076]|uniref:MupA/Atu3671 family FMN-dependent luciferase-like monooxygenase n=1 Tax=Micromonospora sp. WMMD1076 TaxID=3016103 RepID=UPI002499B043|nr:MupA/Atu3671 family FMN-dependent luciferase-like monooxygenase [Micromonospora sp. WMMD1076]WFF05924.1 aminotransferase class III-fold pyridoxal phosphate-dependent enzyme [Micromonospora sp. WMMD1076]